MQNDLISRNALLQKFNDTGAEITFDLPVEELLGEDVDIDAFSILVEDAIQAYRKMVIDAIKEQPTAYDVEKVDEQLDDLCFTIGDYAGFVVDAEQVSELIRNGGKE